MDPRSSGHREPAALGSGYTVDKDRSSIRVRSASRAMATIRNTAVSILRLAGHTSITIALRHHSRDAHRPIELLHTI
ncbi:hypothetical protein [Rhodococcus sp. ABRD24]|uniref:hypothetical protein n=1 Tax=Rhodococcus sp. ABRD24 TaxID=2507582 RepID=UPI001F619A94|nr:hypothetical protein [Rhodococcus sp. ABRD24]